jgi:hypothetical protein
LGAQPTGESGAEAAGALDAEPVQRAPLSRPRDELGVAGPGGGDLGRSQVASELVDGDRDVLVAAGQVGSPDKTAMGLAVGLL